MQCNDCDHLSKNTAACILAKSKPRHNTAEALPGSFLQSRRERHQLQTSVPQHAFTGIAAGRCVLGVLSVKKPGLAPEEAFTAALPALSPEVGDFSRSADATAPGGSRVGLKHHFATRKEALLGYKVVLVLQPHPSGG